MEFINKNSVKNLIINSNFNSDVHFHGDVFLYDNYSPTEEILLIAENIYLNSMIF